jgi:hypothetical protein
MRRSLLPILLVCLTPAAAFAQIAGGSTPLALDLKKVPVGAWSEYTMTVAMGSGMTMKSRWSLVARNSGASTLEMTAEGGPVAQMGGKMIMRMVLAPDPIKADKPVTELVMQMGDKDPMQLPLNMPGMPAQKFQKPDPKKLVGKEQIKVAGGTFKTSHYRDVTDSATVDSWVSDQAPPLGMVKVSTTPKPGATGPRGEPLPPVTMELSGRGKDAKPQITKTAKPFDPSMMGGPGGHPGAGPPPAAHPAPSGATAPGAAEAPAKK